MKTIILIMALVVAGCTGTITRPNDIEYQAGGRDADFVAETFYESGAVKSRCSPNLKSANNYPEGVQLTVVAHGDGLCSVTLNLPKVDAGEAATSNAMTFTVAPEMINAAVGVLLQRLLPPQ